MITFRDKGGGPAITQQAWTTLFNNTDFRAVAFHYRDGIHIRTTWTGVDHGDGLIYRSTVRINSEDPPREERRYTSFIGAIAGHVALVRKYLGADFPHGIDNPAFVEEAP